MPKIECTFKVSVIGCGSVGATTAYSYLLSGTVTDLILVDLDKSKAKGLHLDLEHALPFTPYMNIEAGDDFEACAGSQIVVVTAGARQKEGQTRLDLVNTNKKIFDTIIPKIVRAAPKAILIIVTNPVDILTYHALKISGLPKNQVFGSGTVLDTARLRFHLSQKLRLHPSSIDAYVLGEHGDTSFPVYSSANVLGKPLNKFKGFSNKVAEKCYQDTKNAAYRIIHDQGYTCYSIATAILHITDAIFEDKHEVLPLSIMLKNYYGVNNVCLSVPCILGRAGIEGVIEVPLDIKEKKALRKSANTLKKFCT